MVAQIDGVNIESRSRGMPYLIGPAARSPFSPEFVQYHIDPKLLTVPI